MGFWVLSDTETCQPGQCCFWFFPSNPEDMGGIRFSFLLFLTNKTSVTVQAVGCWHKYSNFFVRVTVIATYFLAIEHYERLT